MAFGVEEPHVARVGVGTGLAWLGHAGVPSTVRAGPGHRRRLRLRARGRREDVEEDVDDETPQVWSYVAAPNGLLGVGKVSGRSSGVRVAMTAAVRSRLSRFGSMGLPCHGRMRGGSSV